jgi:hypothetical protein
VIGKMPKLGTALFVELISRARSSDDQITGGLDDGAGAVAGVDRGLAKIEDGPEGGEDGDQELNGSLEKETSIDLGYPFLSGEQAGRRDTDENQAESESDGFGDEIFPHSDLLIMVRLASGNDQRSKAIKTAPRRILSIILIQGLGII